MRIKLALSLMMIVLITALGAFAQTGPQMTYHGRIVDSTTNLGINGVVIFRVQVRTPTTAADNCVMYEEEITKSISNGVFTLNINSGGGTRLDSSGYSVQQVFSNKNTFGSFALAGAACASGNPFTFTPTATDARRVNIVFNDSTMVAGTFEPLPTQTISYVPSAIESLNVGGFPVDALLRVVNGAGSPAVLSPLSNAQYTELMNLVTGASTQYLLATNPAVGFTGTLSGDVTGTQSATSVRKIYGTPVSATAPTAGQYMIFNGTNWTPAAGSGGTVQDVTSGNGYITITTPTIHPVVTVNVGTIANTVAAGDDARILGAFQTATVLTSGDLSGTLPSPTVSFVGGKTAAQVATSVTDTMNATNLATANTLVKRDGSGNTAFNTASATNFSGRNLYLFDSTNTNSVHVVAPATLPTGYTLTLPTTTPVAGYFLGTSATGDLVWQNPTTGSVTSVSVTAPLQTTGGFTPTLSMPAATGAASGYLTSGDWTTFNNKLATTLPNGQVWVGNAGNVATPRNFISTDIKQSVAPNGNWFNVAGACPTGQALNYSAITDQVSCAAYAITSSQVTTALGYTPTSNALAPGQILVGNTSSVATPTAMTGDATIDASGDLTIANNAITTAKIANLAVTDAKIAAGVNWNKITSTPTTAAGYGITDVILLNSGGVVSMQAGTLAARPAPTTNGRVYITTDTGEIYRDNGVAWILVGSALGSGGTVTNVTSTSPISVATGSSTPVISISQASAVANGYLSSGDWSVFNSKLASSLSSGLIFVGNAGGTAAGVALSGDATLDNLGNLTLAPSGASNGTYTKVTVDTKGRVTNGTQLNSNDVTTALGYVPTTAVLPNGQIFIGNAGNVATPQTVSGDASLTNSGTLTLAPSGATAGTYKSITVDAKGRVTGGTNPTTLSGFGITDGIQNLGVGAASNVNTFEAGTLAGRPAAGNAGHMYVSTDTGETYRDNGAVWVKVGSATGTGGTVTSVNVAAPLNVLNPTTTPIISMFAADGTSSGGTDTDGYLTAANFNTFYNKLGTTTSFSGDVSGTYNATSVNKIRGTNVSIAALTNGNLLRYNGTNWVNTNLISSDVTVGLGYTPVNKAGDNMLGALSMGGFDITGSGNILMNTNKSLGLSNLTAAQETTLIGTLTAADKGRMWFNSTLAQIKYWDGAAALSVSNTSGSISQINGLTATSQDFTTGTGGTDFAITSAGSTHTFSIPTSNGVVNRGLLSSADWTTFNNKVATNTAHSGDVSGTVSTMSVDKIKGQTLTLGAQTAGNYLRNTGTAWVNSNLVSSDITNSLGFTPTTNALASGNIFVGNAGGVATGVVLSGDASIVSSGVLTLTNTAVSAGTYGSANAVPSFTVDSKGRITSATSQAYQNANGASKGIVQIGANITQAAGVISIQSTDVTNALGFVPATNTLPNGQIFVGNASNQATAQILSGDATIANDGTLTINPGVITTSKIANGAITDAKVANGIFWSKLTSTPTTIAGYGITDAILTNAGGVTSMQAGTLAARPAAGSAGRMYVTTDTGEIYRDTGGSWNKVGSATGLGGTVTSVSGVAPITVLAGTSTPIISMTAADGTASGGTDTDGYLSAANFNIFYNKLNNSLANGSIWVGNASNVPTARVVSGDASINNAGSLTFNTTGVGAGTYTKVTVDTKGRVTAATNLISSDVTSGLGYTPVNKAGDNMLGALAMGGFDITGSGNILMNSNKSLGLSNLTAAQETTLAGTLTAADKGRMWFNSTLGQIKYWDGAAALSVSNTAGSIAQLNGLTAVSQDFTTGFAGTDFNISSTGSTHTFNIPTSNGVVTRGLLSSADYSSFAAKLGTTTTFSGDISGTYNSTNVAKLQNQTLTLGAQTAGNYLRNTGTAWVNSNLVSSDITNSLGFTPTTNALASGNIFVGNAGGVATSVVMSGDASIVSSGVLTLSNTAVSAGTYGSANAVPSFTVDSKGRITNATSQAYQNANGASKGIVQIGANITQAAGVISIQSTDVTNALGFTPSSASLTSAFIFVGNGSNIATGVALSGDASITNAGVLSINNNAITNAKINDVNWSKVTGTPTTIAGYGITNGVTNLGVSAATNVGSFQAGTFATRPAFGTAGRMYVATDTAEIYRDTGAAWTKVGSAAGAGGTVTSVNVTAPLFNAGNATGTPIIYMNAADGTASGGADTDGYLSAANFNIFYNKLGTTTVHSGDVTGVYNNLALTTTGVGAGTYTKVTVDTKGRVTTGTNLISSDVTSGLGYTPVNKAGDNMLGALAMGGFDITGSGNILMSANKSLGLSNLTAAQETTLTGTLTAADKGRMWYNSTSGQMKYWDGAAAQSMATGGTAISQLNGLTNASQDFTTGFAGTDFNISSAGNTHTFNIPTSNGVVTRGLLSSADWTTFNNKVATNTTHSGDVSGTVSTMSVDKIKGKSVVPVGYATNQYLRYDGTNWVNSLLVSSDITTSLGFIPSTSALASGNIFVGNAGGVATSVVMSGDAGISNAGIVTINPSAITTAKINDNAITTIKVNNLAITDAKINDVNWSKVTGTPTTVAGYGITNGVTNLGVSAATNVSSFQAGTFASRPAFGTAGRMYVATDTAEIYRDTGAAWTKVGSASGAGGTVTNVSVTAPIKNAGNATGTPILYMDAADGTASGGSDLDGYLSAANFNLFYNKLGTTTVHSGDVTGVYNNLALTTTGVGAGTYTKLTVDTKGRVTTGTNLVSTDVTSGLGYVPVNKAGDNITGSLSVGTASNAAATAVLDLVSTTKGFLMPRMTTAQRTGIGSPATGLQVYDTDLSAIFYYNGGSWTQLSTGASAVSSLNGQTGALTVVAGSSAASSDFTVTTTGSTITLNLPTATSTVRGALSAADWATFNNKVSLTTVYSGDISGNASTTSVDKIKGKSVVPVAYAANQYLRYDGTNWVNSLMVSSDITTSLGFVPSTSALASGNIFVGNAGGVATSVVMSGDAGISNAGIVTINPSAITTAKVNNLAITDAKINDVNWSKVTGTPTTVAGYGITNAITNLGVSAATNVSSFQAGTFASRPAFGTAGRMYVATDTAEIYRDTGAAWTKVGSASGAGGTVTSVNVTAPIQNAGNATGTPILFMNAADGTTSGGSDTDGYLSAVNFNIFYNKLGTTTVHSGDVTGVYNNLALTNTGVTAGTYSKVTVDAKGRVIASSAINSTDVTNALTYVPVNKAGDNITGSLSVGTASNAAATAVLDLVSTTKGFLMPRMTTAQRTGIGSPATGLQVYDTDLSAIFYYNGGSWTQLSTGASAVASLNGQTGALTVVAGTSAASSDFTVTTTGSTITLNLPTATSTVRGALSAADWTTFKNKVDASTVISGDISGSLSATSVDKIKGKSVVPVGYATNQYLRYDGTNWVNSLMVSSDITTSLGFVPSTSALASGNIFVGNAGGVATSVVMSGDAGISNAGIVTINPSAITTAKINDNAITTVKVNNLAITDAKINDVNWSKVTGTPSTVAGYGITNAVTNLGVSAATNVSSFQAGTFASRPAFGTAGRMYVATDTAEIYRDTGAAWTKVGSASGAGGTVTNVSVTAPIKNAGNATGTPILYMDAADGTASGGSDLDGYLSAANFNLFYNKLGTTTVHSGDVTGVYNNLALTTTGVGAGTYTKVTVDTKGRVTAGTNLISTDVTSGLGYVPVNKAGDTMTGSLGIGAAPNSTAILDLTSTAKGFLLPRMTTAQRTGIGLPATGLQVYDTDLSAIFFYNGGSWTQLSTGSSAVASLNGQTGAITVVAGSSAASSDFTVTTTGTTITLNLPTATSTVRGALSAADFVTFRNKVDASTVISGDISGSLSATSVDKIKGKSVVPVAYAANQYLRYDGTNWVNSLLVSSDITTSLGFTPSTNALASGNIFVGSAGGVATSVVMSGDASITNAGIVTLKNSAATRSNLGLGTAAVFNVPAAGDAAVGEVVKGSDSRLTDSRAPSGTASGDLTGTYPNPTLAASGVTAGTYMKVTVDAKGRVTNNVAVNSGDITAGLGYVPVNKAGDNITGSLSVGTASNAAATAVLDLVSTTKGFLMPRMTTAQRTGIGSPATGLQVYDTDLSAIFFYNGGSWTQLSTGSSAVSSLNGQTGAITVVAGTSAASSDFTVTTTGTTVTLNLPTATSTVRGALSAADFVTFRNKVDASTVISGDISGSLSATSVDKIKAKSVVPVAYAANQYLRYDGTNWVNSLMVSSDITTSLGFVPSTSALANTHIFVGSAGGVATDVALSGDAAITNAGVMTIANNAITTVKVNNLAITDAKINDVNWSKVTGTPTTIAGYGITNAVTNLGVSAATNVSSFQAGTFASRPAFGTAGRMYVATDTAEIYRDTGAAWTKVGSASGAGGTVTNVSVTAPLYNAGNATGTPIIYMNQADGVSSGGSDTDGYLSAANFNLFYNKLGTTTAFSGDISGAYNTTSVDKIKGKSIVPAGYATNQYLRYNGTNWVNSLLVSSDITTSIGTLPVANGGTGANSLGAGNLLVGGGTGATTSLAAGTIGNVIVATGAAAWTSTDPDTAGLVNKTSVQTISGAKAFSATVQMNAQNEVRFADADSSNYVSFRAPATVTSNVTWTLPSADGTSGQVLKTDGAGLLSWITPSAGGVTSVNGQSGAMTFVAGTSAASSDFTVTTTGTTVTLNLPTATSSVRGALSAADFVTFNGKMSTSTVVSGDVSGPATAYSVDKIKGKSVVPVGYATNQYLRYDGTNWVNSLLVSSDITTSIGILPVANGGTGRATLTSGSVLVGNGTGTVNYLTAGTAGDVMYATGAGAWTTGTKNQASIVQNGGNSFSATATIGTADANNLNLVTAGTVRASFDQSGAMQVNGQAYSNVATSSAASPLGWDANTSNVMRWTTATASPTVNITNMKAGAAYMLVVKGAGTGTVTITCAGSGVSSATPLYVPANGARVGGTASSKTVYTIMADGENCLVTWITGY